jgi:hypothetical protein
MVTKKADMRIQQMAFMILFVFVFFAVAGLFVLSIQTRGIKQSFQDLQRSSALSSIKPIADMPEFNCGSSESLCLDEDKLYAVSLISSSYENFWPVTSIKVRKIFPRPGGEEIRCPQANCTYYEIYDSGQENTEEYGTFVSICKQVNIEGSIIRECGIGKLDVGVKIKS